MNRRWIQRLTGSAAAGPFVVSLVALLAVLITLDPGREWPSTVEGPGITLDESFNAQMGVYLTNALAAFGPFVVDPGTAQEIFQSYNADHPPLGRLWLGVFHVLAHGEFPGTQFHDDFNILAARTGSAVAFALTVFVLGVLITKHWGRCAGTVAAVALIAMPRLFGHAHLAALETVLNLFWTLALAALLRILPARNSSDQTIVAPDSPPHEFPPTWKQATIAGCLLGCVALTKIQFVLLPPIVVLWMLWHWRTKAIKPLLIWSIVGAVVFVVGWPWLWLKVPDNLLQFLGRSTDRVTLKCFYFGQVYLDNDVPWHFPWVMFVVTLPLPWLFLGSLGIVTQRRHWLTDPRVSLWLLALLAPLLLFSTRVAVYDGDRLFLPSFVSWAALCGIGGRCAWDWLQAHFRRPCWALALGIAITVAPLISMRPYWLSYYSGLVGGLRGAQAMGFEVDYWSQAFSRSFWEHMSQHVPDHEVIGISPSLHGFHAREVQRASAWCQEHDWRLEPFDVERSTRRFAIVFERRADRYSDAQFRASGFEPVAVTRRQGVVIATLWKRSSH